MILKFFKKLTDLIYSIKLQFIMVTSKTSIYNA